MLTRVLIVLGALVALGVAFKFVHMDGKKDGRAEIRDQLVKDRVITLEEGRKVDEKVVNADDSALCNLLGGC